VYDWRGVVVVDVVHELALQSKTSLDEGAGRSLYAQRWPWNKA